MYQNIYYEKRKRLIHLWDDESGYKSFRYISKGFRLDPNGEYKTIYGDTVSRADYWSNDEFESGKIFESDIRPEIATLIDLYLDDDIPSKTHRTLFFDIETERTDKYSTPQAADNKITAISAYDTQNKEYYVWVLDEEIKQEQFNKDDVHIYPYTNERDLLIAFLEYWTTLKPTIVSGWNIDYYDIPYLINRLKNVLGKKSALKLSPINIIDESTDKTRYTIAGVSNLDQLYLYKKYNEGERADYKLNTIAMTELGEGKVEYNGSLQQLYETDKNKFIEYSITDTRLCVKLEEKLKFIDLTLALCHECHVPYDFVWFSSFYLDGAIITYARRNKLVLPNRVGFRKTVNARGALVKNPKAGLYKWVYDLDLKSLYPSIIISFNISPETKIGKIANWDEMKYYQNELEMYDITWINNETELFDDDKFRKFINERNINITSNGMMYRTDIKGIIPTVLKNWALDRDESKRLRNKYKTEQNVEMTQFHNTRQWVSKIKQNSLYGVLLLPSFRFGDFDNGEAVTVTGQSVITFTIKVGNTFYYNKLKDHYKITDENGTEYFIKDTDLHTIERDGNKITIPTKDLRPADEIIDR